MPKSEHTTAQNAKIEAVAQCYASHKRNGESDEEAEDSVRKMAANQSLDTATILAGIDVGKKYLRLSIEERPFDWGGEKELKSAWFIVRGADKSVVGGPCESLREAEDLSKGL